MEYERKEKFHTRKEITEKAKVKNGEKRKNRWKTSFTKGKANYGQKENRQRNFLKKKKKRKSLMN